MKRHLVWVVALVLFLGVAAPRAEANLTAVKQISDHLVSKQDVTGVWNTGYLYPAPGGAPAITGPLDTFITSGTTALGLVKAAYLSILGKGGGIITGGDAAAYIGAADTTYAGELAAIGYTGGGAATGMTYPGALQGILAAKSGISATALATATEEIQRLSGENSSGTAAAEAAAILGALQALYPGSPATVALNAGYAVQAFMQLAPGDVAKTPGGAPLPYTANAVGVALANLLDVTYGSGGTPFVLGADVYLQGVAGVVRALVAAGIDPTAAPAFGDDWLGLIAALQDGFGFYDDTITNLVAATGDGLDAIATALRAGFGLGYMGSATAAFDVMGSFIEEVNLFAPWLPGVNGGFVFYSGGYLNLPYIDGLGLAGIAAHAPEPATWALFGLGLGGLAYARRRRRAKKA